MEKITLKTSDGVELAADYFRADQPKEWIVFLHMMPATKESWTDLARIFQVEGFESVAIDLRGHGKSQDGPNGYKDFSIFQHQKSILDVESAVEFLKKQGAEADRICLIGASIGANLSLQYLARHSDVKASVLFSPGLDYHGVNAERAVRDIKDSQKLFFISSENDDGNSGEVEQLFNKTPAKVRKELKIYETGGHGTHILESHPELEKLIVKFIK